MKMHRQQATGAAGRWLVWTLLAVVVSASVAQQVPLPGQGFELLQGADEQADGTSPVRRIRRDPAPVKTDSDSGPPEEPPIDGKSNNVDRHYMNGANTRLRRMTFADYGDGTSSLAGANRQSARAISNIVNEQSVSKPNSLGLSDYVWQWGQFLDHDIDLTDGMDPPENANIQVPAGDVWFDPEDTGTQEISFNRSIYVAHSGTDSDNPRQQLNEITGWIDASNVYGSDVERATALRRLDGTGRLKTSWGNLLPFNQDGLSNAGGDSAELFVAGDVRSNEQVGLTAMHTVFLREHNRLAGEIAEEHPDWSGDQIYNRARRLVIGLMQAVTYREFLPALLGPDALSKYSGYHPGVNARIMNEFATAAYRMGHSLLSPVLLRLDRDLNEIPEGHLPLVDAFFSPTRITDEGGIEPILRGLAVQPCQDFDVYVIDAVRNFLFGPPGAGGFDLASLNIQRGRDHGLPDYNAMRLAFGLEPRTTFAQISSDPEVVKRLAEAYASPDDIDPWVGGLAEDPLPGALVGELVSAILADQFRRLRDGDRFWYQNMLNHQDQDFVEHSRLARIIRRNTRVGRELGDLDVFRVD